MGQYFSNHHEAYVWVLLVGGLLFILFECLQGAE